MKDSKDYYNQTANLYHIECEKRKAYLNAIDKLVVERAAKIGVNNYLDIGSGDGRRAIKIANSIDENITTYLLYDSDKMLMNCEPNASIKIINTSIFDFDVKERFDLITCLWNVIGHFPTKNHMLQFFKKISTLLTTNGVFMFDVNNRYNISHYGQVSVAQNMHDDYFKNEDAGWFTIGEKPNQTKVYIHSPFDIYGYLNDANLELRRTCFLDYHTGELKPIFFEGQLFYELTKPS